MGMWHRSCLTTLTAGDITVTGATKGTLTGTGFDRTLAISNITVADGATVTVAVANPAGFTITSSKQDVVWKNMVYYHILRNLIMVMSPPALSSVTPLLRTPALYPLSG